MSNPKAPVPHLTARCRHRRPRTQVGRLLEAIAGLLLTPLLVIAHLGTMFGLMAARSPGVVVETQTASGTGLGTAQAAGTYFVAGLTERGDNVDPVLLRSMGDYRKKVGSRVAYGTLHDDLETFFNEGGQRAYVARVVGGAATKGTLTLKDRAGVPLDTLKIDAKDPGAWSADVTIEVADGIVANTYKLVVRYKTEIVEIYDNLANPPAAVTALAKSGYVRATDLGSATAAPNNNPAVLAATALSAGSDDRASVVAQTYIDALARFGPDLGPGAAAIPGQTAATVGSGLMTHARDHRRIALLATASGQTPTQAETTATSLRNTAGAEFAGLFYPWVETPDGAGGTRKISPEGYVAGVRARAIGQAGTWRAPAGEIAVARHVVGLEKVLTKDEIDSATAEHVNTIRSLAGTTRLYGWRSLSTDTLHYLFLSARDVLNDIAFQAEQALEPFVFRTIDGRGHLFSEVEGTVAGIVEPFRAAGGIFEKTDAEGNRVDIGYSIDTGPTVNTEATIAAGEVRAALSVRPSPVGELVRLLITKVAVGGEL